MYVSVPLFLAGLAVGLAAIYFDDLRKKVVIRPVPGRTESVQYKDAMSDCFTFVPVETPCATA